jgi:putative holliday junction resolvase
MLVATPQELKTALGSGHRLAGLDVGTKTIGVAISDLTLFLASPLSTVRRSKFATDAAELEKVVAQERVGGMVIGLPVNMDGSEGPRCQSVRQFVANLQARPQPIWRELPLLLWDERLSTAAVTRTLIEADASRRKRAEVVDKMAAAYILQGVLDALRLTTLAPERGEGGRA